MRRAILNVFGIEVQLLKSLIHLAKCSKLFFLMHLSKFKEASIVAVSHPAVTHSDQEVLQHVFNADLWMQRLGDTLESTPKQAQRGVPPQTGSS